MSKMKLRLCLLIACLLVVHSSPAQGLSLLGLKLDLNSILSPLGLVRKAPATDTNIEPVDVKPEVPVDEDQTVVREARQINLDTSTSAPTDSSPAADDATTIASGSSSGPDDDAVIQPVTDKDEAVVDEVKTDAPEVTQADPEENKPVSEDPTISTPEATPSATEESPVSEDSKPVTEESSSATTEVALPIPQEIPVAEDSTPVVDESSTDAPEVTPATPEGSTVDDSTPVVDESSTDAPEVTPATPEGSTVDDSTPIVDESSTDAPEVTPATPEESTVDDSTPVVDENSTDAPEVTPATPEGSTVDDSTPVVDESSTDAPEVTPATPEESTVDDSTPVVDESSTDAPEVTPATPEESTVVDDSKPVVDEDNSTATSKDDVVTPRIGDNDPINTAPTQGSPLAPVICKQNEEYAACKAYCPQSCDQPYPPECNGLLCQPGCNCKKGYIRDSLNRCILPIFCPFDKAFPWLKKLLFDRPQMDCGENAEYSTCSNFCVKTCKFPDRMCALTSMDVCTQSCACKDGFVLNEYGRCVRVGEC